MTRIGALRLAFIGLAIFVTLGLGRHQIAAAILPEYHFDRGYTLIESIGYALVFWVGQIIAALMALYGFYRFLVLKENQRDS